MLNPATCEVLASQESATLCDDACVPVPLSVSVAGELEALLSNVTLPVEASAVCGAKVTVKEALFPAGTVAGNVTR